MEISVFEIIEHIKTKGIEYEYTGENVVVKGFSSLKHYKEGTLTWIKNEKTLSESDKSIEVKLIIAEKDLLINRKNVIYCNGSKKAFFSTIEEFFNKSEIKLPIGEGTYISKNVKLGENVRIGCNCVLDGEIEIGDNTTIGHNVVIINKVSIGKNCIIQSGVIIGEDGFAYTEDEAHKKTMVKHYGGVNIGNNIFIGMHVNIARGTIDDTIIRDGVKFAPQCHVGHNTYFGEDCTVITSIVYGSAEIGENAYIADSTIRNQCKVGENSIVGMGSVVTKNIEPNITVIGAPAKEIIKKQ